MLRSPPFLAELLPPEELIVLLPLLVLALEFIFLRLLPVGEVENAETSTLSKVDKSFGNWCYLS
jgi:hypothetical protein